MFNRFLNIVRMSTANNKQIFIEIYKYFSFLKYIKR